MRLAAFALVFLAALGLALGPPAEAKPKRADKAAPASAQKPGTLLSYDRIGLPRIYRAKAWRILYVTRDYRMRPILSTGIVVLPDNAPRIPMERQVRGLGAPDHRHRAGNARPRCGPRPSRPSAASTTWWRAGWWWPRPTIPASEPTGPWAISSARARPMR